MTRTRRAILWAVVVILSATQAAARSCDLARSDFRPRHGSDAFLLRSRADRGQVVWELTFRNTGEVFGFRTEVDPTRGNGLLSVPGREGMNPDMRVSFSLSGEDGSKVPPLPGHSVTAVSFVDLAKVFMEYRTRLGQSADPSNFPPAGVWPLAECRAE